MEQHLEGKIAVVTGGNAGIGKAIVELFAAEGAKVVIFATNQERGEAVVKEIEQKHGDGAAQFLKVDVSNTAAVETAIKSVVDSHGRIDILVNNAGVTRDNLLMKIKEEDWDTVLQVNLKSCYNTCKAVYRPMLKARKGKIINISSVVGLTGNAGQVNYAASKSGMIGLTKSLAKELASRGICVNGIAPGFIATKMTEGMNEAELKEAVAHIPMKRMGAPEDIAQAALYLASDQANYVTGQFLTVDGGIAM